MIAKAFFCFKVIFTVAVIFYLFTILDYNRIVFLLPSLVPEYIVLAYVLVLFSIIASSIRWSFLLKQLGISQSPLVSGHYFLISMFYGVMLPGTIGADVIRLTLSIKLHGLTRKFMLAVSIVMERACGLLSILAIFAVMHLLISFAPLAQQPYFGEIHYPVLAVVLGVALFVISVRLVPRNWLEKQKIISSLLQRISELIQGFRHLSWIDVLKIFGLSASANLLDIVSSYFLAQALHIDVSIYFFLVVIPIVYLATAIPISIGGLGVREGVLTFFLVQTGVVASDAVLLAFLIYLNRLGVAMIGGVLQARKL